MNWQAIGNDFTTDHGSISAELISGHMTLTVDGSLADHMTNLTELIYVPQAPCEITHISLVIDNDDDASVKQAWKSFDWLSIEHDWTLEISRNPWRHTFSLAVDA